MSTKKAKPRSRKRPTVWERDFRKLRSLAQEVIEQCGHFERNIAKGADDTIRGVVVAGTTEIMAIVGRRLYRRWRRNRGEKV